MNYEELSRVLRYGADHSTTQSLLQTLHETPEARWPQGDNPHHQRLITADALGDSGRHEEEALLRDPKQHVVIHEGRVRRGRFSIGPAVVAARELDNYLDEITDDNRAGLPHYLDGASIVNGPDNRVQIYRDRVAGDDYYDSHFLDHISQLPHHLAGEFDAELRDEQHLNSPEEEARYAHLLQQLRTAPVEVPIPENPT